MIQDCNAEIAPWKAPFLLLSIFCICAATYAIVPLLPIYFTEEIANGGLGWTKSDALSLYGTFLAVVYAAPFFGGVLGDFVLGKPISGLLGYGLIANGLFFLNTSSTRGALSLALLSLGLGFGFVKVNLTASVGSLPKKMLRKATITTISLQASDSLPAVFQPTGFSALTRYPESSRPSLESP